jgi:hypothetical protein
VPVIGVRGVPMRMGEVAVLMLVIVTLGKHEGLPRHRSPARRSEGR